MRHVFFCFVEEVLLANIAYTKTFQMYRNLHVKGFVEAYFCKCREAIHAAIERNTLTVCGDRISLDMSRVSSKVCIANRLQVHCPKRLARIAPRLAMATRGSQT
jgi:hypothetical protein